MDPQLRERVRELKEIIENERIDEAKFYAYCAKYLRHGMPKGKEVIRDYFGLLIDLKKLNKTNLKLEGDINPKELSDSELMNISHALLFLEFLFDDLKTFNYSTIFFDFILQVKDYGNISKMLIDKIDDDILRDKILYLNFIILFRNDPEKTFKSTKKYFLASLLKMTYYEAAEGLKEIYQFLIVNFINKSFLYNAIRKRDGVKIINYTQMIFFFNETYKIGYEKLNFEIPQEDVQDPKYLMKYFNAIEEGDRKKILRNLLHLRPQKESTAAGVFYRSGLITRYSLGYSILSENPTINQQNFIRVFLAKDISFSCYVEFLRKFIHTFINIK